MHRSIYILALSVLRFAVGDETIGLCCLCDGCGPPVRFSELVDSKGTSCGLLANQMADPSHGSPQGSSQCRNLQNLHYDRCCNPNFDPAPIAQAPTPSPGTKYNHGPHPPCNLCANGSFPTNPSSLTAVATIPGTPTCGDLYWIAKNGNIEERMCRPMQNYFATPCGCLSGGNGGGGAPDIPVPAPVRATVPVATPTRAVVPTPTRVVLPTPSSAAYPPNNPSRTMPVRTMKNSTEPMLEETCIRNENWPRKDRLFVEQRIDLLSPYNVQ